MPAHTHHLQQPDTTEGNVIRDLLCRPAGRARRLHSRGRVQSRLLLSADRQRDVLNASRAGDQFKWQTALIMTSRGRIPPATSLHINNVDWTQPMSDHGSSRPSLKLGLRSTGGRCRCRPLLIQPSEPVSLQVIDASCEAMTLTITPEPVFKSHAARYGFCDRTEHRHVT